MKGATAEPCASTSRPPIAKTIRMIGSNQNFLRTRMNIHSSLRNAMATSELVRKAVRIRSRRGAIDPIAAARRVILSAHGVPAGAPFHPSERRNHEEEQYAEHDRTDDPVEHLREFHPGSV